MIRNAPVLLLDEPTTGLDAGSTERVLTPLRRLMAGRTSLIISHNLLTVTDADQILYLEKGRDHGGGHARPAAVDVAGLRAAVPHAPGAGRPAAGARPGPHVQPHPQPRRPLPRPTASAPPESTR